jgi:hypothetical protein
MRIRKIVTIVAMSVPLAAGFTGLHALAQAPAAGIPAPPPGGINNSKLPDIEGVHLGMTVDQATATMKSLFPGNALQVYYSHYDKGPMWVARLVGTVADTCNSQCGDIVELVFSEPPNPQQVVSISRVLILAPGKQPTLDTTAASLRQKYGKELASVKAPIMAWAYDEQGQPVDARGPANWSPADCAGQKFGVSPGETLPGQGLEVDYVLGPVPLASQLAGLTGNLCNRNVYVTAQPLVGSLQGVPIVAQIYLYVTEKPLMLRDAIAGQQYLDGLAAATQQQQQKNAAQQKAPTL